MAPRCSDQSAQGNCQMKLSASFLLVGVLVLSLPCVGHGDPLPVQDLDCPGRGCPGATLAPENNVGTSSVDRDGAPGDFFERVPQAPEYGNYCQTYWGRYGPGPVNPLGSPCSAAGPNGPEHGFVVR